MIKVPYLDLKRQYKALEGEVLKAMQRVCESTQFVQGPEASLFENEFVEYCEAGHAVTLNSGTSALHLALRCLDIQPGDEIITVPMTFIATSWAISYVGATPVYVDIDPVRRTMDPAKIESAITPRTKAILPVHLFGIPADLKPIMEIAERYRMPVIEDAAQAHGARYEGKRVGQFGAMSCFSFYPTKNLGAYGEGGILMTRDASVAERASMLRDQGQRKQYRHEELGYNYRMDSLQAAILRIKLPHLDRWNSQRVQHAKVYQHLLEGLPLTVPQSPAGVDAVWHCFVIEVEKRDEIRQKLSDEGIETRLHYPCPLHLQPAYAQLGYKLGDFPHSERLAERCLSLPLFPELSVTEIETVCAALRKVMLS
jgi:dTDP-4-amino-4,6-dideoxygalactose transaminase